MSSPSASQTQDDVARFIDAMRAPKSPSRNGSSRKTYEEPDASEYLFDDFKGELEGEAEYLLYPLLPREAYVTVWGDNSSSKSTVMLSLALQGARMGLRSTYYALEDPPSRTRDKIQRLDPDFETLEGFRYGSSPIDLSWDGQVASLVKREKEWGSDLVIIDTYSHAFTPRSEDANAQAIEFAKTARQHIIPEVGCSLVILDHTSHAIHGEPRGASAKLQQVDLAIKMEEQTRWVAGKPSLWTMDNKKPSRYGNPFFYHGEVVDLPDRGLKVNFVCPEERQPQWRIDDDDDCPF